MDETSKSGSTGVYQHPKRPVFLKAPTSILAALGCAATHRIDLSGRAEGAARIGFPQGRKIYGTTRLEGRTYHFCTEEVSFEEAANRCRQARGFLVGVESDGEQQWLSEAARRLNMAEGWIGHRVTDGAWQRVDGVSSTVDFTDADDNSGGNCASLDASRSGWQKTDCQEPLPYICAF